MNEENLIEELVEMLSELIKKHTKETLKGEKKLC